MNTNRNVLVVGASRGLGLALVERYCERGDSVVATVRRSGSEIEALVARYPSQLEVETVDIGVADSIRALQSRLAGRTLDTLFVNAGICRATDRTPLTVDDDDFLDMMRINALGAMRLVELFHAQVAEQGVIAVMSSEIGSIGNATGFWELYSASKTALNMLMQSFAARHTGDPRALRLVAPGWVRTHMGTDDATLSVEESIPAVVDVVEASAGQGGLRFMDRFGDSLPW